MYSMSKIEIKLAYDESAEKTDKHFSMCIILYILIGDEFSLVSSSDCF